MAQCLGWGPSGSPHGRSGRRLHLIRLRAVPVVNALDGTRPIVAQQELAGCYLTCFNSFQLSTRALEVRLRTGTSLFSSSSIWSRCLGRGTSAGRPQTAM